MKQLENMTNGACAPFRQISSSSKTQDKTCHKELHDNMWNIEDLNFKEREEVEF